jgi:hypothetical protein
LYPSRSERCRLFADIDILLADAATADVKKQLIRALSRAMVLQAVLHIEADSNIGNLARYWDKGGKAKDLFPLLSSLSRVPGGYALDAAHLLPPFAREKLLTWSPPGTNSWSSRETAFLTAANFFSVNVQKTLQEESRFIDEIDALYYMVPGQAVFGDVIVFIDGRERVLHACTFIADDVVFTKNPGYYTSPWAFMDVRDVERHFAAQEPVIKRIFRRRDA